MQIIRGIALNTYLRYLKLRRTAQIATLVFSRYAQSTTRSQPVCITPPVEYCVSFQAVNLLRLRYVYVTFMLRLRYVYAEPTRQSGCGRRGRRHLPRGSTVLLQTQEIEEIKG